MQKLEVQEMNVKMPCRRENIASIKDCGGIHLDSIWYLLLFFSLDLPLVMSDDVPDWP